MQILSNYSNYNVFKSNLNCPGFQSFPKIFGPKKIGPKKFGPKKSVLKIGPKKFGPKKSVLKIGHKILVTK